MRLLIYCANFYPECLGIGKYSGEMAEWFACRRHDVRVVAAPPYYPEWRVGAGYSCWKYKREVWKKQSLLSESQALLVSELTVWRCPLWVPNKPSGLKRIVHLASFALSSFPVMLRQILWRPDVVLVVEPPLFCTPAAWLVARLSGGRAWLHVQDFEVDAAFDLGLLKGARLRGWVLGAERWLLRRFDRVSTISRRMLARLLNKGVAAERSVLFLNWVDLAGLKADEASCRSLRTELGISADAVIALYSGNMGAKQGLEILSQAAALLQADSRLQFVFCGNGAGRADLMARCAGLTNVRFLEVQPLERLGSLLGMADIHLLPQRADAADLVMPSKLTGMLASGRPMVATAQVGTELAEVVSGRGVVVPPGDAVKFAAAVAALSVDPERRRELGAAGRSYAEANLAKDAVLEQFEQMLIRLNAK